MISMKRKLALFTLLTLICACSITINPTTSKEVTRNSNQDLSNAPETETMEQLTISDTIALCQELHNDEEIPIGCKYDYLDGKPALIMTFPDSEIADRTVEALVKSIAKPFCEAANKSNRQAFLVFLVPKKRTMMLHSCETKETTDWFNIDELQNQTQL